MVVLTRFVTSKRLQIDPDFAGVFEVKKVRQTHCFQMAGLVISAFTELSPKKSSSSDKGSAIQCHREEWDCIIFGDKGSAIWRIGPTTLNIHASGWPRPGHLVAKLGTFHCQEILPFVALTKCMQ